MAAARTVADIAELLRELRRRHARQRRDSPLTYRELAMKTGWSQSAIGEYFAGRTLPPTDRLDALADLLGATADELSALGTARDRVEELHRGGAPPPSPGGQVVPVPRQLPRNMAGFVGRVSELERLDALLSQDEQVPSVVIAAVSGTAGVGKTALAVRWAHRVADRFPDGQLYINLRGFDPGGSPVAPAEAVRQFLDALDVPPQRIPADLDAQAALYRCLLAGKKILVVLDNARDPAQIRPLLPGEPGCLVLVTSRDHLPGLVAADGAHPLSLDLLTLAEARELLTQRAGPDRVAAEPSAVERIFTACARLPLALAIVAARAATQPQLSLARLADDLYDRNGRLDALATGDPGTEVRAVFSWSYHALTPDAARLFRLLGLPPGSDFSTPAAASLAGLSPTAARALLAELVQASLLAESADGRYVLHDLLRAYATHLTHTIDPDHERQTANHRILDHYLHTAHTADRLLYPAREPITLPAAHPESTPEHLADHDQALAWFTTEHPVLLAAIEHAATIGFDDHIWQLAWTLYTFLDRQGRWRDQTIAQHAAIAAANRLGDQAAQAHAHRSLAYVNVRQGRFDDAQSELRVALSLYQEIGDKTGQAHAHHTLAHLWEGQSRPAEALDHAREALDLYQAAGFQLGQAIALNTVGWLHSLLGDYEQALADCEQALTLCRQLDDRSGQAHAWDSLGYAHHHLGHHAQAVTCYQHATGLHRDLGDRYNEATSLTRLGDTHYAANAIDVAREAWQQALTILTALDHPDASTLQSRLAGCA